MNLPLRTYWNLLAHHVRPRLNLFAGLLALMLFSIGLQVVNPQIMRSFIDSALAGQALSLVTGVALAFIGVAVLQQVTSVGVTYFSESLAWFATNALRGELSRHCLNLDMGFHSEHAPGELIERIDGDVTELATFFSQFLVTLTSNLLLLVGILAALYWEDWRVGLIFTLFAVFSLWLINRVRDYAVPNQKARRQAEADLYGFVEEQLNATEDIRSSGAVGYSLRELFRLHAVILQHDRTAQLKSWFVESLMGILLTVGNALAIGVGYALYREGSISVGTVYLFIHYMNLIETPIWVLIHTLRQFQTIGACVERLTELRAFKPKVLDGSLNNLPAGPLGLDFEDVTFGYSAEEAVLCGMTFSLQPGKVLGLLGRTGSGKTTLARLIFRLYDPDSGHVYLHGQNLRQTRLSALRSRVAMVTQEVQLFKASIRDNLTFFDSSIPDERIQAVIAEMGLADWFAKLPNGLDTVLESGGRGLSAGEAQLLALTRVFLRDPGLVVLDEASSRLDPATEQRIEQAIDRLLKNRTAIIIAHRLGTVHRADEILILDAGDIQEYGDRRSLAADPNSRFYHLLQTGLEEVLV